MPGSLASIYPTSYNSCFSKTQDKIQKTPKPSCFFQAVLRWPPSGDPQNEEYVNAH